VITVSGGEVSASAGQLRLTTVQVETEVGPGAALESWIDHDRALVPRSAVYPSGPTADQSDQRNADQLAAWERSAETAVVRGPGI
jgi:PDZ domain-containing protein